MEPGGHQSYCQGRPKRINWGMLEFRRQATNHGGQVVTFTRFPREAATLAHGKGEQEAPDRQQGPGTDTLGLGGMLVSRSAS